MIINLVLVALSIVLCMFLTTWRGPHWLICFAVLAGGIFLFPGTLWAAGELDPDHLGIASSAFGITSYMAAILLVTVAILGRGHRLSLPVSHVIFMAVLVGATIFLWEGTSQQWAGVAHFGTAVLAFALGKYLGRYLHNDSSDSYFWAVSLTGVLAIQTTVSILQRAGVDFLLSPIIAEPNVDRVTGTLGNTANLGKVVFLILLVLLPMTHSSLLRTRNTAMVGVALALLLGGMSVSRANMIAIASLLGLWIIFGPIKRIVRVRFVIASLLVAGYVMFSERFVARFEEDPAGTLRPQLMSAALEVLPSAIWTGIGPNSYVDPAGLGHPVHNAIALLVIELGIPTSILFLLPIIVLWRGSLKRSSTDLEAALYSRAVLLSVPGICVILWTGWGMMSSFLLPGWLLICGVLQAKVFSQSTPPGTLPETIQRTARAYQLTTKRQGGDAC